MSDLPGEMMNAIFVAPASSMRSIRCSLTARGRSTGPSKRLPTGSSSFENARGWMRVPAPAAGMIPHMVLSFVRSVMRTRVHRLFERTDQGVGAAGSRVLLERAGARARGDAPQFFIGTCDRVHRLLCRRRDQNF